MVSPHDDPIELTHSQHERWTREFVAECRRIGEALSTHNLNSHIKRIEHVGSTAVPELAAKDIVDLDIVVADSAVAVVSETLEAELGGTRLENTDGWHPIFRVHENQRFNNHVFAASDHRWKVSVVTRDVLSNHSNLRAEYEQLKRELAHDHDDLTAYSRGKTTFIERVLTVGQRDDNIEFDFTLSIDHK